MSLLQNEYRLALGDLTISLICTPHETVGYLANWFNIPSSKNEPDITLDFEIITHDDEPDLPNSLLIHKTVNADGTFNISNGLLAGHYDPATRHGSLKAKFVLLQGQLARILEQIFYQAFHSAKQTGPLQAFLIHSAAVIYKGEGYLFVGPSEAGKSTVARLSLEHVVLGDEMNLVVANESSMELIGTPFNGLFREKQPGRAPLRAVFLLEQALKHNISEIGIAEAVTALAAEIAPPVGLNEISVPETIPTMVDLASLFVGRTAIKRLSFLPDSGFWDCINQKFGTWKPLLAAGHSSEVSLMLTLDTVLTQNKLCPVRIVGDGLLIMSADGTFTHSLKDLGAYVWNQIDGKSDLNAIKVSILSTFETTELKAGQDLLSFATQLLNADLVITSKI